MWKYVPDIPQGSHLTSFSLVPSTKLMPGPLIIVCRLPASWAFSSSRDVTKKKRSYELTGITIFPKNHILFRPTFFLQNNIFFFKIPFILGENKFVFPLSVLSKFFSFFLFFPPFCSLSPFFFSFSSSFPPKF